ncbi:hypothetical protein Q4603_07305 [Zobellia galactanivorans]|uniref:hypothetical protein n=1 Tax=Zobellia TaxID=112040 RepID=UPI000B534129|nr:MULTISPECIES: hypothetical protein [Zobellia]MBU3028128.1 hypothetical protein [Zobellia galactanivorans]MDO6515797.1 hypothetical protein [Zobellia uliginosa]MDO6808409.1 hypothetical protein [Zobellia galactanivorans]OWW26454.1 hypothetical protein B4Q04_01860 [Zobellia sp. OII3]
MKRLFSILIVLSTLSCSKDGVVRNPYLQEVGFRFDMNLNLPLYSQLTNIGSIVFVDNAGVGIRGIYVIQSGIDQYRAFEATCPNHVPNDCSTMTQNGLEVTCSCDDLVYNLFTGQLINPPEEGKRYYDMLEYRATRSGRIILVTN